MCWLQQLIFPVMTIDKNEPEDVPAKENDESPHRKEITEKVKTEQSMDINAIVNGILVLAMNTTIYEIFFYSTEFSIFNSINSYYK